MKKLIFILAVILPMAVFAQKSPVDKLFEKYANQKGFTTVNISGKLLSFASQVDDLNDDGNWGEASNIMAELKGVRILTVENEELNKKIDFYAELEKDGFFKNHDYEVLMEVTEDDEVVRFLAKDAGNGKISDLLLIVGGDDNALISIRGMIDPENIGKITKSLDIDLGDIKIDK